MQIRNTGQSFGLATKLLHWSTALLIIFLIWLGWYMVDLSYFDRWYIRSLNWHRALGMMVLGLAAIKIGWQVYSPLPRTTGKLRPWERRAADAVHLLLLAMMVLVPATGYLISTSAGQGIPLFGWFEVPALFKVSNGIRDLAISLHFYLAYGTAFLVLGHAGAALKHEFLDRDGILARMIWK